MENKYKLEFPETIKSYVDGANDFAEYAIKHHRGVSIYDYEMKDILIKFLEQFGVVRECEHEWVFIGASYTDFYTIHHYECSKCGAKKSTSIGI